MMDSYSKVILTIIAIALVAINLKLWEPRPANAAKISDVVTLNAPMNSESLSETERQKLIARVPVVAVWAILNK